MSKPTLDLPRYAPTAAMERRPLPSPYFPSLFTYLLFQYFLSLTLMAAMESNLTMANHWLRKQKSLMLICWTHWRMLSFL